jgi:hypothetical protein
LFSRSLKVGKSARNLRRLAFALSRKLLPNRPFLRLPRQSLLDAFAGAGVLLGFPFGTAGGIFTFGNAATKAVDLLPQWGRSIDRLRRRDKRPRLEIGLFAVGAMEPDAKLTREFQCR